MSKPAITGDILLATLAGGGIVPVRWKHPGSACIGIGTDYLNAKFIQDPPFSTDNTSVEVLAGVGFDADENWTDEQAWNTEWRNNIHGSGKVWLYWMYEHGKTDDLPDTKIHGGEFEPFNRYPGDNRSGTLGYIWTFKFSDVSFNDLRCIAEQLVAEWL